MTLWRRFFEYDIKVSSMTLHGLNFNFFGCRYVDKMLEMISLAGDFVAGAVWHRIIQIVTNHKDLQVQHVHYMDLDLKA